jgi:hypothetical protein
MCSAPSFDKSSASGKSEAPAAESSVVPKAAARGKSPALEVATGDRSPAPEVMPEAEEETGVVVGAMASSPAHEPATSEPATLSSLAGGTSLGSRAVATADVAATFAEEPEVVLGHPLLATAGEVSLDEVVVTSHWALSRVQDVLHRESRVATEECRGLELWATMQTERRFLRRRHCMQGINIST